jgi:hypothetical protein
VNVKAGEIKVTAVLQRLKCFSLLHHVQIRSGSSQHLIQTQSTWDFWWTETHVADFFSCQYHSAVAHIHLSIIWGLDKGPVWGPVSWDTVSSHGTNKNNISYLLLLEPRQRQRNFPLASVSRRPLGPTQAPTGSPFQGKKRGRGVTLTTHFYLVPKSRMSRTYTLPLGTCMSMAGQLYFT